MSTFMLCNVTFMCHNECVIYGLFKTPLECEEHEIKTTNGKESSFHPLDQTMVKFF